MLKLVERSEIKEVIILLVFSGLLSETLTKPTMILVLIGAIMVWRQIKTTRLIRNALTLGIFGSYWLTYGKLIDPEIGLNFLTSIIVLKLLEKQTQRDQFMIFMGLILLISAGSLFQKNIMYVVFFALSFFILIQELYKNLKISNRLVDIGQSLLWVLPLSTILFFFAPRMMNPFQMERGGPKEGEVGYTPDVNLSQIESVSYNDRPVFQAAVDSPLPSADLYWRGNTLTFSDGWNWPLMPQNRPSIEFSESDIPSSPGAIRQSIRTFTQQDFFFGLDRPLSFRTAKGVVKLSGSRTLAQSRTRPISKYEVISVEGDLNAEASESAVSASRSGLTSIELEWVEKNFKSNNLPDLQEEIQKHFLREKFSYNLSPGRVSGFLEFMKDKKVGFCSHYASALAQILRAKKIKARLVSGFLGGSYNRFAGFYQVTQNDAHVWVEAFHQNRWIRLDPTEWIAPDRVQLGGEAFMQKSIEGTQLAAFRSFRRKLALFGDFEQWLGQWDFKFNLWLEEMDYYGQEALFEKFHFKREWVFSLIPTLLALFIGLYVWLLSRRKENKTEIEEVWSLFLQKIRKQGEELPLTSLVECEKIMMSKDQGLQALWKELVKVTFQETQITSLKELRKKIQRL